MKKFLCLVLVLVVFTSFMVGCGNDTTDTTPQTEESDVAPNDTANSETPDASSETESGVKNPATQPSSSANSSEVSSSENSDGKPDIYFLSSGGSDADSISYHLKNCSALSGKEHQQISWEMVQALGFRNCAKCKPPKYDGYIE